eukprot:3053148-Pyramimonas_sp.AAC.1
MNPSPRTSRPPITHLSSICLYLAPARTRAAFSAQAPPKRLFVTVTCDSASSQCHGKPTDLSQTTRVAMYDATPRAYSVNPSVHHECTSRCVETREDAGKMQGSCYSHQGRDSPCSHLTASSLCLFDVIRYELSPSEQFNVLMKPNGQYPGMTCKSYVTSELQDCTVGS